MNELKIIQEKCLSNNTEICIEGLKLASDIVNQITNMSLGLINNKQLDTLFIVENIANIFNDFFYSLVKMLNSENKDLRFWSATLLIHFSLENDEAEKIMLDVIKCGDREKGELAATILKRKKRIQ